LRPPIASVRLFAPRKFLQPHRFDADHATPSSNMAARKSLYREAAFVEQRNAEASDALVVENAVLRQAREEVLEHPVHERSMLRG